MRRGPACGFRLPVKLPEMLASIAKGAAKFCGHAI
jgi:hypothetical protein